MIIAFLIALLLCIALFVYALRVTGQRNRLEHDVTLVRAASDGWRSAWANERKKNDPVIIGSRRQADDITVVFGTDFTESPRQRELRAKDALRKARRK